MCVFLVFKALSYSLHFIMSTLISQTVLLQVFQLHRWVV